jgi:hypothetical protein
MAQTHATSVGHRHCDTGGLNVLNVLLAADYPFADVMWTMLVFFAWVIWIWLLIMVLWDNFSRTDHSGWAKAGWTLFVIFLPLLGVLVYMIARPAEGVGLMTRGART